MTSRRTLLKAATGLGAAAQIAAGAPQFRVTDRAYWLSLLKRLASPILENLARGSLKRNMPVECSGNPEARRRYTHLEALARLLAGIAPWLETSLEPGPERDLQRKFGNLARESLHSATDPASPDHLNFSEGDQPLVDCGFLSQAVLRAPNQLWNKLDKDTQTRLTAALTSSRVITPPYSNWLLFSAMVETTLAIMGAQWNPVPIDYAVQKISEWYVGDGTYGDGPQFHWDYYDSFVIHPMLLDVLRQIAPHSERWRHFLPDALTRARRYAAVQERMISPDGAFPPIGRSISYRCGAFHLLAQIALLGELPPPLTPPQIRSAITAVMHRLMDAPGTFDDNGWLSIGFCGHQPSLGEPYISTGSLYLCAAALLPLGLPPSNPFWSGRHEDWTSRRILAGKDTPADHAI